MVRSHFKTSFKAKLSEKSLVKAGGKIRLGGVLRHVETLFCRQRRSMGFAANCSRKEF